MSNHLYYLWRWNNLYNYYELLEIAYDATKEEISQKVKSEYSRWRKRVNAPDPARQREAEEIMELLHEAESVLLDDEKRAQYDRELSDYYARQEQAQAQAEQSSAVEQSYGNQTRAEVERYLSEAEQFIDNQDFTNAIVTARRATELDGQNPTAWVLLARARYHWGEISDALYEINRAIEIEPNNAYYYYLEHLCHLKRKDLNNEDKLRLALQSIQKSMNVEPNHSGYKIDYAYIMLHMNRYREGINILTDLHSRNELNTFGKGVLSELYYKEGINLAVRVNYTQGNPQYFFVDRESAEQGLNNFERAFEFVQNEEFATEIRKWIGIANETLQNKIQIKNLFITIALGFVTFLFLTGGSVLGTIIMGGLTYLSWTRTSVPRYKLNEEYIKSL